MIPYLDVYLNDQLIGGLIQNRHGRMVFEYAKSWLDRPDAIALSQSLPLVKKRFNPNECRPYFAGILPEQDIRKVVARNLGVSANNDFSLLEQIGGECAGAVTFTRGGYPLPVSSSAYRDVTEKELAVILRNLPKRPLMAGDEGVRLSLAGAQGKITIRRVGGAISIPLNGSPSTHILKPAVERFEGLVFNEAFCMKLARAVGLEAAHVEVGRAEDIDYLLVERYDRIALDRSVASSPLRRLHQEDFCQALGIVPEKKYQNEGGPSLKQSFDLLRGTSSIPVIDLQSLLNAVIFNFLIGNHDAHGKNFSLLYGDGGTTRLAPMYDVLATSYYSELARKMAMKIGGEYMSANILADHFEYLAVEVGFTKPMVNRRVLEMAELVIAKLPESAIDHEVSRGVSKLIQGNCEQIIKKFKR
jgi:serine/threonine-protein kinase HipA